MKKIYVAAIMLVFGFVLAEAELTVKIYPVGGGEPTEYNSNSITSLVLFDPAATYRVKLYGYGKVQASESLLKVDSITFSGLNANLVLHKGSSSSSYNIAEIDSVVFRDRNDPYFYETVTIGDQVWMAENLDVTHYRNGDKIPQVTDPDEWAELTTGAWCYYDNDDDNNETYGKLYNWYAVNDSRGLAPEGWHVASDEEWDELEDYLKAYSEYWCDNNSNNIAKALASTDLWESTTNTCAVGNDLSTNNASGFTGRPGGYRSYSTGYFYNIGAHGYWWSSTEYSSTTAILWYLYYNYSSFYRYHDNKSYGFSVRCVRD